MAGVTVIVPAAVVAGLTTSGASAGKSSSMLAMAGAKTAPAHPDAGIPLMDAARRGTPRAAGRGRCGYACPVTESAELGRLGAAALREPAADRRGHAWVVRVVVEPVRLLGEPVERGERLERARQQPQQWCIRHPAGAARLEDGQRRPGLAEQCGYPDPVGPGLHQVAVRLALRRVGALAVDRLVLAAGPRPGR